MQREPYSRPEMTPSETKTTVLLLSLVSLMMSRTLADSQEGAPPPEPSGQNRPKD
jgi:hypothetical protein